MAQQMEALQREIDEENRAREKEERERVEHEELEQEWVKKEKMERGKLEREIRERRLAYKVNQMVQAGKMEVEGSKCKGKERLQVTVEVHGREVKVEGGSKTPAAAVPGYEEQPGRICDGCRNKAIVSNKILYINSEAYQVHVALQVVERSWQWGTHHPQD
jgi:hypothetical protein